MQTDCSSCLVLRDGSSGRYPRYSSASLSRANSWDCSLLRKPGRVSRMWLVSCYEKKMSVNNLSGILSRKQVSKETTEGIKDFL